MLRTRTPVEALGEEDRDAVLAFCAASPAATVFVAARLLDGSLRGRTGSLLGRRDESGRIDSLVWASANIVPLGLDPTSAGAYADRLRRWRHRCASILGPSDQVALLWSRLADDWGSPRAIRRHQPLLTTTTPPSALGVPVSRDVRPARRSEVDLVLPAAEHMFTAEIGYPPYVGSARAYRHSLLALVEEGRTYVVVEDGKVVFKADVGSVALDCAQVQGVWLSPELRGRGRAVPYMAAVVEQVMNDHAREVSLYVNDFNAPALATYFRCGFTEVGSYTTVLL